MHSKPETTRPAKRTREKAPLARRASWGAVRRLVLGHCCCEQALWGADAIEIADRFGERDDIRAYFWLRSKRLM